MDDSPWITPKMVGKTTATPVRTPFGSGLPGSGLMFHISTNYAWRHDDPSSTKSPVRFVKIANGMTYRKESARG